MRETFDHRAPAEGAEPSLDRWLRFDAATERRYEAEHGAARAQHLVHVSLIGMVVFNVYVLTGLLLMPDLTAEVVILRIFIVTPMSAVLICLLPHLPARLREWTVTIGMLNASAVPTWLFYTTQSPLAPHIVSEFVLGMVFGNMLLAMRFRHAVVFSAGILLMAVVALLSKTGLDESLRLTAMIQLSTACAFTLYANYLAERRRCRSYLQETRALIRAETAESFQSQLAQISRTDPLTGLPNRRHLDAQMAEWQRGSGTLAVMMVDIDHFKPFNDALGHTAGDDCLRRVAGVFADLARNPDVFCARFGGEEFTVIARETSAPDARGMADRIVRAIAGLGIAHPARPDGMPIVTASVGLVHTATPGTADAIDLLDRADAALYRVKAAGRNGFADAADDPLRRAGGL